MTLRCSESAWHDRHPEGAGMTNAAIALNEPPRMRTTLCNSLHSAFLRALSVRIDLALSVSLLESRKSHRAFHAFRVEPGINTLVLMHS